MAAPIKSFRIINPSIEDDGAPEENRPGPASAIGVDGCRAGWFAVRLDAAAYTLALYSVLPPATALPAASLILMDIPLGLPFQKARACDRIARHRLGRPRASSVFPTPCREALAAADYRDACALNRRVLGVGLSKQTYHLFPKIREADLWRRGLNPRGPTVRECHPELAFLALAGGAGPVFGKKTPQGKAERLRILREYEPRTETLYREARARHRVKDLADDDILDALALAVTARMGRDRLISIPTAPEFDALGLPMEIVFAKL